MTATAVDAPRATRREWIGLLVIALPCMLYSMDLTVLNLALPQISADLAKAANLRMAFALAHELEPHGATAVSLTPGWLRSEAMLEAYGVSESNWRDATERSPHFAISESPAFVGRAVATLARDPNVSRWNGKSLSSGQLAKIYGFTDLDGSRPDAWRYVTEVQDAGKPADVAGYR